jgi:hypothetical protein
MLELFCRTAGSDECRREKNVSYRRAEESKMVSTMKKLLDESCARPSFREDVEKTMLGKVNQTIALVTTSHNSISSSLTAQKSCQSVCPGHVFQISLIREY